MRHQLSKSTFMYGCQCPKRLFLHKHGRDLRNTNDHAQQFMLQAGTDVGELARQLFPGGVDASPPDAYAYHISVEKTKAFIRQGESIIYEAAFQFEGVLCALDILVRKGNAWYAFEVKSSTSVKAQHVQDAALQYFVITNCGLHVHDISIVFLNNQYVRKGALYTHQLFSTQSVVAEAIEKQDFVKDKVRTFKTMLAQRNAPVVDIGPHCFTPYGCDFTDHCFSHMQAEDSIFELPGRIAWKLYADGYKALNHIPEDYELSDKVNMQLLHHRTGEVFMDKTQIRKFLSPLTHPLYFFDFETIMPGIPEFDDSKPYQQIPFQYSLHVQRTRHAAKEHFSFLGDGIKDPRSELLTSMLRHLGTSGSILCYNMNFEKQRIKELATLYPDFEKELLAINERVVDLMIPFARRWYYHPDFKGSYSIKAVLPVLIPELRYDALPIQEGGMASLVYAQLKWQDEETVSIQRQQLLDYCKMDTLAMVKILGYLRQVIS